MAAHIRLRSPTGLTAEFHSHGALRRLMYGELSVNLFVGSQVEGGPANLWLRRYQGDALLARPLLGPRSATRFGRENDASLIGQGEWGSLRYRITFALDAREAAWMWSVRVVNAGPAETLDLLYAQDLALAPYGAVRTNEYYVSQYLDHTPLQHPARGWTIATRQNLPVDGRTPWSLLFSVRRATSFATDALQVYGVEHRSLARTVPPPSPGRRWQHEHAMAVLQDEALRLERDAEVTFGFVGLIDGDHPHASSSADLSHVERVPCVVEFDLAKSMAPPTATDVSLFATAPDLRSLELAEGDLDALFERPRRREERADSGALLSFFCGEARHIVLRPKELAVLRPHGAVLRTGAALTPDEAALTSTVWMNGVFNSMLTQGHVSINRTLSTVRSYLGLFRAHGQRVFVEVDGAWRLLNLPSAFEMRPGAARWLYRYEGGLLELQTQASPRSHALTFTIRVLAGPPVRCLLVHHMALNGDDGAALAPAEYVHDGRVVSVKPASDSDMRARFASGVFRMELIEGALERVGGDEMLYGGGGSRGEPYVCLAAVASPALTLQMSADFIAQSADPELDHRARFDISIQPPSHSPLGGPAAALSEILPWFIDNALVHYLAPRGLEQYTGGGWGTRDVTQGPMELLLAFGCLGPTRDLLLRVMRAQNADGDWPQWFMFFERDQRLRAGDSHGDVVFWPLLALAQYLLASGDADVLEATAPFHAQDAAGGEGTVWEHVQRALAVIDHRVIPGTALAAYGHGDWNDSLQPADPQMRDRMCSAWTVTLHHQTLTTLADALRSIGRSAEAAALEARVQPIREDFQRLLIVDDVLTGYALFETNGVRYLLHPRDGTSGVKYSALAMVHAILEGLFTPAQARAHLALIERELTGPDGLRLFDRPMPYAGGVQRLFQRAESAAYFGREIGLMYMHAHLRYAQALAHLGEADRFFHALRQANPIGLEEICGQAAPRQANCYYSSSDAVFADRYEARADYARLHRGETPLEGGWRVYSSGAGITVGLLVRRFLGVTQSHDALALDPVMPAALDGLRAAMRIFGRPATIEYRVAARGCGVHTVRVNGARVELTRDANPYRTGAVRAPRSVIETLMLSGDNWIEIEIE